MSIPRPPQETAAPRRVLSRRAALWLGLFVALVVYPILVGAIPWVLSLLLPRYGWTTNGPAVGNLLGLIPVAMGVAGLAWVFGVMLAQVPKLPERIELDARENLATATARVLVTHGPFAVSRNPMFLSGLLVLLGWAVFYGSGLILVLCIVGWCFANFVKIPREESALEVRFEQEYRDYKAKVPRWLAFPKH